MVWWCRSVTNREDESTAAAAEKMAAPGSCRGPAAIAGQLSEVVGRDLQTDMETCAGMAKLSGLTVGKLPASESTTFRPGFIFRAAPSTLNRLTEVESQATTLPAPPPISLEILSPTVIGWSIQPFLFLWLPRCNEKDVRNKWRATRHSMHAVQHACSRARSRLTRAVAAASAAASAASAGPAVMFFFSCSVRCRCRCLRRRRRRCSCCCSACCQGVAHQEVIKSLPHSCVMTEATRASTPAGSGPSEFPSR